MNQRFYLIDSHATIHRAYHAIRGLANPDGHPTGAVFGFTRVLLAMIRDHAPELLAVAADSRGKVFRHEIYEQYKANRPPMPDDLAWQIPKVEAICEGYGIPVYRLQGYEADDIIGTLARQAAGAGYQVVIVSDDKDVLQLVGDGIGVFAPSKNNKQGKFYDAAEVESDRGVPPGKIVDLMGLTGDSSDNVPGVPGIGPKTALKLMSKYGGMEDVLANAEKEKGKRRENLLNFADQARLSRELVTINCEVPVKFDAAAAAISPPDVSRLQPLFQELGFREMLRGLLENVAPSQESEDADYRTVVRPSELRELAHALVEAELVSVDLETTGIDPMRADIVGLSFSIQPGRAFYVPVRAPGSEPVCPWEEVERLFKPLLENPNLAKTGQNIKYDMIVLARNGIELRGVKFDTMLADYLLAPGEQRHNIDALAMEHLGYRKTATSEVIGKGKDQTTMDLVPVETVSRYACEDADIALRLARVLRQKLVEKGLLRLLEEVEVPLVETLAGMQRCGISVDTDMLGGMSSSISQVLEVKEQEIYEAAGREFNIQSPRQLGTVLFDELELPGKKKTKTGYSTDERTLVDLAPMHPLPRLVLEYRGLAKLRNTYVDRLPGWVNPGTGRIHCTLNQTGTATGRLSSSDPNLQNIPIRTELGRSIRACFVPGEDGWQMLSADYSQIELRMLAHFSNDEALRAAFREDKDIHRFVAAQVFGVPEDRIDEDQRRRAKAVNFGIIYGQTGWGLARNLGIAQSEALEFQEEYFARYPGVAECRDRIVAECRKRGFVTTILDRRRYFPDINAGDAHVRRGAERAAINTVFQGSAADLIKVAMNRIHAEMLRRQMRSRMLLQIHDELLFEAPPDELGELAGGVERLMIGAVDLGVPLKVSVGTGPNWLEVK